MIGTPQILSFDVFGTLLDLKEDKESPEAYRYLARWLGYHGLPVDGGELQALLDLRAREDLQANPEPYPDVDLPALFESTMQELAPGSRHMVHELLPEAMLILRSLTTISLSPVPGAREVLMELAGSYRLGICSNTQRAFTIGELRMFGLLEFFEHIVFSSDIQASKPNPKMFETLLSRFAGPADLVVHIGDRRGDDIVPAAALGMGTVLLEREATEGTGALLEIGATPVISSLEELPGVIRKLGTQR